VAYSVGFLTSMRAGTGARIAQNARPKGWEAGAGTAAPATPRDDGPRRWPELDRGLLAREKAPAVTGWAGLACRYAHPGCGAKKIERRPAAVTV